MGVLKQQETNTTLSGHYLFIQNVLKKVMFTYLKI